MSIFESLQNLLGGVAGGIADNSVVQDLQDQASTVTDGASEAASSVTEQGQTAVDDITQNLGL